MGKLTICGLFYSVLNLKQYSVVARAFLEINLPFLIDLFVCCFSLLYNSFPFKINDSNKFINGLRIL